MSGKITGPLYKHSFKLFATVVRQAGRQAGRLAVSLKFKF